MKHQPEGRAVGVIAAFQRGKRDAGAGRSMLVPYAGREKQEAYERGYRWARLHRERSRPRLRVAKKRAR